MRNAICLAGLIVAVVIGQLAIVPVLLPAVLRPDLGILVAIAVLAMGRREFGLVAVFALGVQADLFGSARFGLLTVSYMLAAGVILLVTWRELTRGDLLASWLGGVAGTFLAHIFYILIGKLLHLDVIWGQSFAVLFSLMLAALLWGLPVAVVCGRWMYWTGTLSLPVREKWANEARMAAARKGKLQKA
jgi:hypothetical protein